MNVNISIHPILIFDRHIAHECRSGYVTREIIAQLQKMGLTTIQCTTANDALDIFAYTPEIGAFVFDWDSLTNGKEIEVGEFVKKILLFNDSMPIFILTQKHEIPDADYKALKDVGGFVWKYDDSVDFIAGRLKNQTQAYIESLYPPFFKELYRYSKEYKYAWHTPGHMGGVAFLKSPVGHLFYEFYGENAFRSDLSISVPELGSLMEHSAVLGEAERFAAETFGADFTYFVTNGTSTSNKIALMGSVTKGDVVIVDRNCHKSLQHALTLADVIPIYFKPSRNAYGIIGAIPVSEFKQEAIAAKVAHCPLIKEKLMPKMAVVTNSTYDGLIYNVDHVKDLLAETNIPALHFDEAWFPYARFHPFYSGKYAMSDYHKDYHPTVFATQSTHKLLAAFSQASMVHVKEGALAIDKNLFNETFMMHTSTSPQYSIIASLDISSKMMSGNFGKRLVSESMAEAIAFRQEFAKVEQQFKRDKFMPQWFFSIWQDQAVAKPPKKPEPHFFGYTDLDANKWMLGSKAKWHGFSHVDNDHVYLDPIKVTILTPGIDSSGCLGDFGIPAPIVSKFLMNKGVVDEKTGFYSMLFLFSIGVNKSKAMTLLSDLVTFKQYFDQHDSLQNIFPDIIEKYPERYANKTLADLAKEMHEFLKAYKACEIMHDAFDRLPEQVITPNEAYQHIVRANTELLPLNKVMNRVVLTMVAPYPPGIPVVMPGERLTSETDIIIKYLSLLESFDNEFPGFENEVHGAEIKVENRKRKYYLNCQR